MPPATLRLFFAAPCPPALAARIDTWREAQQLAGRVTPRADLHLTLAFLGHLPAERLPLLERIPSRLPLAELACELHLDSLACWRGGLLHLAPPQVPAELLRLARELRTALDEAGIASDSRPYRPHLTLARNSRMPTSFEPVEFAWPVEELVLYRSWQARYEALRSWPLGATAQSCD
ncbi:MAG: RNA 2',3'-cyclic phosphodiesterase [Pseudomonadaceae bacterium]|nr:RNA 2',3'-cyclic phosphodiesterase [Pseudomonadaceae bacterium]